MRKFWTLLVLVMATGCSTTPYDRGRSFTDSVQDNAIRYGSVAGAGGAGYFAGKELLGGTSGGVAGAAIASGAAYGVQLMGDSQKQRAYDRGYEEGADRARAEIVNEMWRREAEYGLPAGWSTTDGQSKLRNIYVPERTINGVIYPATVQQVEVH